MRRTSGRAAIQRRSSRLLRTPTATEARSEREESLGLRGGAAGDADDDGANDSHVHDPDYGDDLDDHGRSRPRSRAAGNAYRASKIELPGKVRGVTKLANYRPMDYEYMSVEKSDTHEQKMVKLGIDESLLAPAPPHDPLAKWIGPRRGLVELSVTHDPVRQLVGGSAVRGKLWRPTQLRFRNAWPDGELVDDWYKMVYLDLYLRTRRFANRYFGVTDRRTFMGDLPTLGRFDSYWTRGLSDEFMYHASQVARQDNKCGGWEQLLISPETRPLLVQGIIALVLQNSVFDKLLFGASDKAQKVLDDSDALTIRMDGYQRTDLRSQTVRALMMHNTLTEFFWPAVDTLTTQITTLMLPLIKMLDAAFPQSRDTSLRCIYQDLHHIVAEAGYLSIGIRQSRTIFRFSWPEPGQSWDMDQDHSSGAVYDRSKAAAAEEDREHKRLWDEKHKATLAEQAARAKRLHDGKIKVPAGGAGGERVAPATNAATAALASVRSRPVRAMTADVQQGHATNTNAGDGDAAPPLDTPGPRRRGRPRRDTTNKSSGETGKERPATREASRRRSKSRKRTEGGAGFETARDAGGTTRPDWDHMYTPPSRVANVQIVMAPMLQRLTPHGPIGAARGVTQEKLMLAQVVYYCGRGDQGAEYAEAGPTLQQHVSGRRRASWLTPRRWFRLLAWLLSRLACLAVLGFAVFSGLTLLYGSADRAWEVLQAVAAPLFGREP